MASPSASTMEAWLLYTPLQVPAKSLPPTLVFPSRIIGNTALAWNTRKQLQTLRKMIKERTQWKDTP